MTTVSKQKQAMSGQRWLWAAATVGFLSFAALWARPSTPPWPPVVPGRNNTVLFLACEAAGLSNAHIATAAALVERHPGIQVHFASFPKLGSKVSRASDLALKARGLASESLLPGEATKGIIFHSLTSGPGFLDKVEASYWDQVHPPGLAGLETDLGSLQLWLAPWTGPEYEAIYNEVLRLIETEVDPSIVVLDTLFGPGRVAARTLNRLHAFISPNGLSDNFVTRQPWASALWKYPAFGTGYPFPLPWYLIPTNMYINFRMIYGMTMMPKAQEFVRYIKDRGLTDALDFLEQYKDYSPWIAQYVPGAALPVDFVPDNVTTTGPIVLSSVPAEEQDAELIAWMQRGRTVLVNLGSTTLYDVNRATAMVGAILEVLSAQPDLQVLWKYHLNPGMKIDDVVGPVRQLIDKDRLRLSNWLAVDPAALLDTGHIVASVHHGGANCYWEAIGAGVPHIILPSWFDHYNFAGAVEHTGIGVWGCPKTSPAWTKECLAVAFNKLTDGSPAARAMTEKAGRLGQLARKNGPGRNAAAATIAELAASGR